MKRLLDSESFESPKEETVDLLRRMAEDGDNLLKSRDIDFHHLFARKTEAIAFAETVCKQGYGRADHDFWAERSAWLTTVHVRMAPNLDEITATELELDKIAASFEGEPDGWGCMEMI
jgi:regulator of RNase E activity RraB